MISQSSTIPKNMTLPRMIAHLSKSILTDYVLERIEFVPAITGVDVYVSVSLVPFLSFLLQ